MQVWHAIILGLIEGITEFLPISSTGHLTIAEKMLGYSKWCSFGDCGLFLERYFAGFNGMDTWFICK